MYGAEAPLPPSEGFGFRAPPVADTARKASRCRPQVQERIAETRAENGEGAKLSILSAFEGLTEGEITRACCLHRGADEHRVKKRSFAFALVYIKCFRTYSVYLSLRLPAQILYAGIHLPPQREARALPRRAPKLTASERKIATKETHQGCVFVQVAFALQRRGEGAPAPRQRFATARNS